MVSFDSLDASRLDGPEASGLPSRLSQFKALHDLLLICHLFLLTLSPLLERHWVKPLLDEFLHVHQEAAFLCLPDSASIEGTAILLGLQLHILAEGVLSSELIHLPMVFFLMADGEEVIHFDGDGSQQPFPRVVVQLHDARVER